MIRTPTAFIRRSPVYRRLVEAGLAFAPDGGVAIANGRSQAGLSTLTLIDLSVLPRWGLKGRDTFAWLAARGASVPAADQIATVQADGALIGRLSPGEAIVLPPVMGGACALGAAIDGLAAAGNGCCYPVSRRDSHAWFAVRGTGGPKMFAKLCGVDLSPDAFANRQIAQTSLARLSAIVIRNDCAGESAFSILADSASAEYLWDCLLDAMAEFNGTIGGADDLGYPNEPAVNGD